MAETGHAKNVENWQKMIAACAGFGAGYAPTNAELALASMNTLLTGVETAMDGVQTDLVPWKNKVADRENIYEGVRPRTTQILAAFKASGADANKVDNVQTFHRQVTEHEPRQSRWTIQERLRTNRKGTLSRINLTCRSPSPLVRSSP